VESLLISIAHSIPQRFIAIPSLGFVQKPEIPLCRLNGSSEKPL
jgi:hypothetical protein